MYYTRTDFPLIVFIFDVINYNIINLLNNKKGPRENSYLFFHSPHTVQLCSAYDQYMQSEITSYRPYRPLEALEASLVHFLLLYQQRWIQ